MLMNWSFNPNDLYTAGIALVGIVPAMRKFLPALKQAEPAVLAVAKDVGEIAKDAAQFPVVAELEARIKEKEKSLENHVADSGLFQAVSAVVHELGVDVSNMSPQTRTAVALAASTFANQTFGLNVTQAQISDAINKLQNLTTSASAHPAVQGAKQILATPADPIPTPTPPSEAEQPQPATA